MSALSFGRTYPAKSQRTGRKHRKALALKKAKAAQRRARLDRHGSRAKRPVVTKRADPLAGLVPGSKRYERRAKAMARAV